MTGPAKGSRFTDLAGGALMVVVGLGAVLIGRTYPPGSLTRMGPGFFPVALGVLLTATGAVIALAAKASAEPSRHGSMLPDWRGWACILGGVVAFGALGEKAGLIPATFAIVFISALGDRRNSVLSAALLALLMVTFCLIVFVWILRLPFSLFGTTG